MSDTPPISHPPSRLDMVKGFIGDLARPFAIIVTSSAAAWASVVASYRVKDGNDGAFLMGAIFAGVGALYIGKAVEMFKTNRAAADVEIAKTAVATDPRS